MAHAIRMHATGGPEVLVYEEIQVGDPGPGEVRLRHTAIGLNYIDTYHRSGLYPLPMPTSIGSEAAGVVEAVGQGVTWLKRGDRVAYSGGPYVFFDLVMSNVGVCTPENVALSVLTEVIGHQSEKGWVIVDAGWMAMSRDRGTQRQKIDYGYGAVCDVDGKLIEGLIVSGANQEHGIVSRRDGAADAGVVERFPIGTKLRILPNHACATGAQYPAYVAVTPDGDATPWSRFQGW